MKPGKCKNVWTLIMIVIKKEIRKGSFLFSFYWIIYAKFIQPYPTHFTIKNQFGIECSLLGRGGGWNDTDESCVCITKLISIKRATCSILNGTISHLSESFTILVFLYKILLDLSAETKK